MNGFHFYFKQKTENILNQNEWLTDVFDGLKLSKIFKLPLIIEYSSSKYVRLNLEV